MTVELKVEQEGWFTLSAIRNGRVVRSATFQEQRTIGPFHNLILDGGLDRMGSLTGNLSGLNGYFFVGTGTVPPAASDMQLGQQVGVGVSNSWSKVAGVAPDYHTKTIFTGTSPIGAYGTVNLTEIGIGGSSNTLYSRALIADTSGNPVAFPINSDEQLQMSYELRVYPPLEDAVFEVDVAGPRIATVRAEYVTNSNFWGVEGAGTTGPAVALAAPPSSVDWFTGGLGPITGQPQGTQVSGSGARTNSPYSVGSKVREGRISWGSSQANGVLRSHQVCFKIATFQVEYNPPITKNNTQSMYLDYTLSWDRK